MPDLDQPRLPGGAASAPFAARPMALQRFLVPLDGSSLAEAVLPIVERLATAFDPSIVLLHVIEKGAPSRVHGERHLTDLAEAEAYLARVAGELGDRTGIARERVQSHVHEVPVGNVAASIATHAEEHQADVILLSTHGEGGLRDALWGSIAQQVLQLSVRPTLLVQARSHEGIPPGSASFAPRTIMVPLDATVAAEAALPGAVTLARALRAQLRLVMVVATLSTLSGDQAATATFLPGTTRAILEDQQLQAVAYLERLAASIRATGVPSIAEVRRGDAVTELASDTAEHADGLVVVATHGRAGLQAIWSPRVAARLLRRTRAPVLLVPIVEADEA